MLIRAITLGLIAGFILAMTASFLFLPAFPQVIIGRFLDVDVVYMKSGLELHGRVVNETGDSVYLESRKGFFKIPRESCLKVEKGALLRYVRRAI